MRRQHSSHNNLNASAIRPASTSAIPCPARYGYTLLSVRLLCMEGTPSRCELSTTVSARWLSLQKSPCVRRRGHLLYVLAHTHGGFGHQLRDCARGAEPGRRPASGSDPDHPP